MSLRMSWKHAFTMALALTISACGVEKPDDEQVDSIHSALTCREKMEDPSSYSCSAWQSQPCTCSYNHRGSAGVRYLRSCNVPGCPGSGYQEDTDCRYGSNGTVGSGTSCAP